MKSTFATIAFISGFCLHPALAAETNDPIVSLTMSRSTPLGDILKTIDALEAAGVENLPARTTLTAGTSDPVIVLTVNKDTTFASVIRILDTCKAAGLNTVRIRNATAGATAR